MCLLPTDPNIELSVNQSSSGPRWMTWIWHGYRKALLLPYYRAAALWLLLPKRLCSSCRPLLYKKKAHCDCPHKHSSSKKKRIRFASVLILKVKYTEILNQKLPTYHFFAISFIIFLVPRISHLYKISHYTRWYTGVIFTNLFRTNGYLVNK